MPGKENPYWRSAVAVVVAVASIAIGAGLVATSPSAAVPASASLEEQPGIRLPSQDGVRERFSDILNRSHARARQSDRAPTPAIEPGLRPTPRPLPGPTRDAGRGVPGPKASAPSAGTSFLGVQLSDTTDCGPPGCRPPDSMGSVGPSQLVVVVNGRMRVFDKAGKLQFDVGLDAFFDSVRDGEGVSDPHVRYDRLSERWFLVAINIAEPTNKVVLAASSGPTLTNRASFTFFSIPAETGLFADYPTFGLDRSALYIGTNNFVPQGAVSTSGVVVRKSALISGSLVAFRLSNLATGATPGPWTPQGVQNDDPSSTAGYFVGVDTQFFGLLDLRRVNDPGGTPSVSGNLMVPVPATTFPSPVPADGTPPGLDGLDDRLLAAMIARDPVTGAPHLWTAHQIEVDSSGAASDSGGRDGVRWYDIANLVAAPSLAQSGTLFDPAAANPAFYWMGSIAANGQGHALLGASVAGVGRFAGIALAQRLHSDPPGSLSSPAIVQPGLAPYNIPNPVASEPQRWGDYSQTEVDPNDNMTFWTFQEYTNATNSWGVRVIQVKAPPPATPSAAALVGSASSAGAGPTEISAGRRSVKVRITGTSSAGSGFFDPGPDPGGPGFADHIAATVGGGVRVKGISFRDPTHVVIDLDTRRARLGPKNVRVTNPDGQSASGKRLLRVVDGQAPRTSVSGPRRTTDRTPTFRFRSNEPGSGFQCKVDGAKFRRCRSPKTVPPQTLGVHVFKVRAIDRAGNVDRTAVRLRFTILP